MTPDAEIAALDDDVRAEYYTVNAAAAVDASHAEKGAGRKDPPLRSPHAIECVPCTLHTDTQAHRQAH